MGRKPKPGPTILRIETLSDGQPHPLRPIIDDFTGQEIPLADNVAIGPIPDAQLTIDAANRAKAAKAQTLLEQVGIVRPTGDALQEPKPVLASNQRMLGDSLVITMPKRPFRRI